MVGKRGLKGVNWTGTQGREGQIFLTPCKTIAMEMGVVRAKITYLKALLHYVLANLQLVLDLLCILTIVKSLAFSSDMNDFLTLNFDIS